jgi:hypothetical protein
MRAAEREDTMICCSVGVVTLAAGLARRRQLARRFGVALPLLSIAVLAAAGLFLGQHAGHYAERARLNQRDLLAEVLAAPLCSGAPATAAERRN